LQIEQPQARKCGMCIAEKITVAALEHFFGVYLITLFLHYETTSDLAKFAQSL
jgi:hypothetical protein